MSKNNEHRNGSLMIALVIGIPCFLSGIFIGTTLCQNKIAKANKNSSRNDGGNVNVDTVVGKSEGSETETETEESDDDDKNKVLIGVDIGGTAIKLGIVSMEGNVVESITENIQDFSFDGVCIMIKNLAEGILGKHGIKLGKRSVAGIGVCVPGILDCEKGLVLKAANFPSWPPNAPLIEKLGELFNGIRGKLENDANAALLAEIWLGAAKGARNAVMITLGTGVGSAIIADGRLLRGHNGFAGEVGHAIFSRNGRFSRGTGVYGVVEEYVSARSVGKIAQERVQIQQQKDPTTEFQSELLNISPVDSITSKHVFDLAKKNDPLALEVVQDTVDILGIVCINLARTLDCNHIIFGGGLTAAGGLLLDGIRRRFKHHHWTLSEPESCHIELAQLGTRSGMIGAAFLGHPLCKNILP